MTIHRNEIRTGLLFVLTLATLVGVILYLGSPGVFVPQKMFKIFFDNSAGLEPGAPVLLAGRRIGQVKSLHSPVPESARPDPKMETMVEIQVAKSARVFKNVKARMMQPTLLGKPVIDFTSGEEASGMAPDGSAFFGEREKGLADAVPTIMEKLSPAIEKATETLDSLQQTSNNLTKLSDDNGDLHAALVEFRKFGTNLNQISGPDSSLRHSLGNIEKLTGDDGKLAKSLDNIHNLTGPDSDLAKTMNNAERFTGKLANNEDIETTLHNLRRISQNVNQRLDDIMDELRATGTNLKQGSDTLKHQPWRLIWPSTKKYPEDRQMAEKPDSEARSSRSARMTTLKKQ